MPLPTLSCTLAATQRCWARGHMASSSKAPSVVWRSPSNGCCHPAILLTHQHSTSRSTRRRVLTLGLEPHTWLEPEQKGVRPPRLGPCLGRVHISAGAASLTWSQKTCRYDFHWLFARQVLPCTIVACHSVLANMHQSCLASVHTGISADWMGASG